MPDFWHEYIAATPQEQRPFYWLALAVLVLSLGFIIAGTVVTWRL